MINGMLHPTANLSNLYLPNEKEGRGLASIEATIETEEYELSDYVKGMNKVHNKFLKSMRKEGTKKEYKNNIKDTEQKSGQRNHRMDSDQA